MTHIWSSPTRSVAVLLMSAAASALAGCTGPTPIPADSASPTSASSTSSARTSTAVPSSGQSSAPTAAGEADDVRLPHQGVRSTDTDFSDWQPTTWAYRPCGDDAPLTFGAGVDARSIVQTGPEYARQEMVAIFPDAAAAIAYVARLDAAVTRCAPAARGEHVMRAGDLAGPWGRGRVYSTSVAVRDGASDATVGHMGLDYLVLARTGRAVAVVRAGGEFTPAIDRFDAAVIADLRPDLELIARQLCRYTLAGCG